MTKTRGMQMKSEGLGIPSPGHSFEKGRGGCGLSAGWLGAGFRITEVFCILKESMKAAESEMAPSIAGQSLKMCLPGRKRGRRD